MRERFLALDGLRGLAALAVLLFHLRRHFHDMPWFGEGYLAVDFFFLLSGFVIAHAYEARLRSRRAILPFLGDRVIRLHPLLLLSLVPGTIEIVRGPVPLTHPIATLIAGAVPFPALWQGGLKAMFFPLNTPSWSLFWELVVNLGFALAVPRLGNRALTVIILFWGAVVAFAAFSGHGFLQTDIFAGARACFGFGLGVMLLRVHRSGRLSLGWIGVAAGPILMASLAPPLLGWGYDLSMIFLVYPLLLLGSAARAPRFERACALLGGLSYPLYILHQPILRATRHLGLGLSLPLLCVAIAGLAWRFYDLPIRAWLRRRFGSGGHEAAPQE